MMERTLGTFQFIVYDKEDANSLIEFCKNEHVRFYAYAEHNCPGVEHHWHFAFLFNKPISIYEIVHLSGVCVDDPSTNKGSFVCLLTYLKSQGKVFTNYRL